MEQQWQGYTDMSSGRQARYSHNAHPTQPQHATREFNGATQQHQPPAGFSYEAYQAPADTSHPNSMATSPAATPHAREYNGDGDIPMEDADPYNRLKYSSRPNHQHRMSGQYLLHEESSAGRRYSPMHTLSPSSPYAASPQQAGHTNYATYTPQTYPSRQSPTRPSPYPSQSQSYYNSPSRLIPRAVCTVLALTLLHVYSYITNTATSSTTNTTSGSKLRSVLSAVRHRPVERCIRTRSKVTSTFANTTPAVIAGLPAWPRTPISETEERPTASAEDQLPASFSSSEP